nr:tetratricopeptide repeat protein [Allomuricauda sp.]
MKTSSCILFFSIICSICSLQGQENQKKIDSILSIIAKTEIDTIKALSYLELSNLTMYNDGKKTLEYIEKADSIYKKSNNDNGVAKLYAQKANYYYRLGKIDSARHYLAKSVDLSFSIGDTLRGAVIRHNIGILDHYQGNTESAKSIMEQNIPIYSKYNDSLHLANALLLKGKIGMYEGFFNIALEETYKALKIHRELKDDFRIAEDLIQIGIIYQTTGENSKAIEIFNESVEQYRKVDNDQSIAQVLNYMVDSKIKLKHFDSARVNLEEAMSISKELDYTSNIARTHYNGGILEYEVENYSKAIKNFELALEIWQSVGSPNNEANSLIYLGRCNLKNKEASKAIGFFDKSIQIAESIKDPEVLSKAYLEKSLALEMSKKHEEALTYFKKNKSISDSIFTIERTKATLELKTQYETEKKEQQIALQDKEITVLEQQAEISTLQKIVLGGGLVLSLIGFYGIRQKLKRNKLEKEKVDAELAFKKKELTTHALHLAKKNEVLEGLRQKAEELKENEVSKKGYQQLIRTINFDLQDDNNWENFSRYFEEVHKDFNRNVKTKYPQVTSNELRLMALLKMNLSSKEIANILNISQEGIKKARYRLRKKLDITTEDSLQDLILSL